jgi:protein-tyrosine phosphatase
MVCLGNICRSPLAEGILQQRAWEAGLNWSVESAGTNGIHTGEPPHRLSQKVARLNGIDISQQRSRRFSAADFDNFDLIFAMASDVMTDMKRIAGKAYREDKVDLLLNVLHPGKGLDVPDPWYGAEPGYHEVFRLINEACIMLVDTKKQTEQIITSTANDVRMTNDK